MPTAATDQAISSRPFRRAPTGTALLELGSRVRDPLQLAQQIARALPAVVRILRQARR